MQYSENQIVHNSQNGQIASGILLQYEKFKQRSAVGIKKYNTTLDRTDLSEDQWKDHLLEELMDAILYLTKIRMK